MNKLSIIGFECSGSINPDTILSGKVTATEEVFNEFSK